MVSATVAKAKDSVHSSMQARGSQAPGAGGIENMLRVARALGSEGCRDALRGQRDEYHRCNMNVIVTGLYDRSYVAAWLRLRTGARRIGYQ